MIFILRLANQRFHRRFHQLKENNYYYYYYYYYLYIRYFEYNSDFSRFSAGAEHQHDIRMKDFAQHSDLLSHLL
jgi:hypothetical protein